MLKRRVFSSLPRHFQNDLNKRLMGSSSDLLFEPENFERIEGQIGDDTGVTQSEKNRVPFIANRDPQTDRHQLSPCVVSYNADDSVRNGAFYSDLLGHLLANGADISDESRLFDTNYFSFNIPIDIDKWTNFSKYFWTGVGTDVSTQAFFKVKEAVATQVKIHQMPQSGNTLIERDVISDASGNLGANSVYVPTGGNEVGDLREDATVANRTIYEWNGSKWNILNFTTVRTEEEIPASAGAGSNFYIARVGQEYQRPVIFHYTDESKRWLSKTPVISLDEPTNPNDGMIWEDCRTKTARRFLIFKQDTWVPLTHSYTTGLSAAGTNGEYKYSAINFTDDDDPWIKENWWVHFEDLNPNDKIRFAGRQSARPIIELWAGLETYDLDLDQNAYEKNRTSLKARSPLFEAYMHNGTSIAKISTMGDFYGNAIFNYKVKRTNTKDEVLGFSPSYDSTGELEFDLYLESATYKKTNGDTIKGYKFFKDTFTGKLHSVWTRSTEPLKFDSESKNVPLNLSNNPNHDIITDISRSTIIDHYRNIINTNAEGVALGSNGYRWTVRDPVNGGTILDTEGSLLLPLAIIQDDRYDLAEAIRNMAFEYHRFMRRFNLQLNKLWKTGSFSTPDDQLNGITATEFVDKILTNIIIHSDTKSPFWNADMGTYVNENTEETLPILVPPSAARTGATQPYKPRIYSTNGIKYILCHDGAVKKAYEDDRDEILLNLENRFFSQVRTEKKTETVASSAFLDGHQFSLKKYAANGPLKTNVENVSSIVNDYSAIGSPTENQRVYSKAHQAYATYKNSSWTTKPAVALDLFKNDQDETFHTFNGLELYEVKYFDRDGTFDYNVSDIYNTVRREFERWYVDQEIDPVANDTFDNSDKWTWNYSSAGVEGGWSGIYRRVYGTDRPHIAPWEILGFSIEPSWWTDAYTADTTDADGNKRYVKTNPMWDDLTTGTLIADENVIIPDKYLLNADAPVPVDSNGDLVDPITAGIVDEDVIMNADAPWRYGDISPAETSFFNSHFGPFAMALAGYLMKPARFVEFLWSDYQYTIGNELAGGSIQVDDGTLKRPQNSDIVVHAETDGYSDSGINAWISENNVLAGKSVKDFGELIRTSNVSLGWKTNGFIDRESTIIKTLSGIEVPFEDIKLAVHVGLPHKNLFHSGIQIVKRGPKYQVYGYDYTNPKFTINLSARPSLAGKTTISEDFIFDGTTTEYSLTKFKVGVNDISEFAVLINGLKVNSEYFNISNGTTLQVIDPSLSVGDTISAVITTRYTNSSTRVKKFTIGTQSYFYYSHPTNTYIEYPYGHEFGSPQEVIEFIADYGTYMTDMGWQYETDDWVDVAKRFASWTQTAKSGEIFVDVASGNDIVLKSSFGNMASINKLVYGGYSLLDIAGYPIQEFETFRFDDKVQVKSDELVFGLRAVIQDVQHAVFISNTTRFNDLIYDPFTGLRQKRLEVHTNRSKEWKGRLETPGYVVSEDTLIPSFEKRTKDIIRYYDGTNPISDVTLRDQALNLYGWYYRNYARNMNVNDIMAFNHHKNAIREKGTKRAARSFAVSKSNEKPLEILECWAWKSGDFGRTPYDNPVRFSIDSNDFQNRIQTVIFGTSEDPYVTQVTDYDRNSTHPRWILPPKKENFKFPMKGSLPSPDYNIRAVLLEDETVNARMFHYDPANGLHEPLAYSQVDIETGFDPAYYNKGPVIAGEGHEWGAEKVGTIWWNTTKRKYKDYRALSVDDAPEKWGELFGYKVNTTTKSGTAFISVLNETPELKIDDRLTIHMKDGTKYNGIVDEISGKTVTYTIMDGPEFVAILSTPIPTDGIDEISTNLIEIFEWVESRVPPKDYVSDDNTVLVYNATTPSYTEITRPDNTKRYYFWVKNLRSVATNKELSTHDITYRLENPTSNLIPWFGIYNEKTMVFNASALERRNDISIQIFTYPQNHESHDQWSLVVEHDKRKIIDEEVSNTIINSLGGVDVNGNSIPAAFRTELDMYGPLLGQTIYKDLTEAKRTFINSLNTILKKYNRFNDSNFTTAFPDLKYKTETDGYWEYQDYDLLGYTPSQSVATLNERDSMIDLLEEDTVRVKKAFSSNSEDFYESYKWVDGGWSRVQSKNSSALVNENIFINLISNMRRIKVFLSIEDFNELMFSMLHEMLRQFNTCHWCYKTSYIDVINTINTGQPATQPFDETNVIENSVLDMKPFHTKIRRYMSSHVLHNGDYPYDETSLTLFDEHYSKLTLFNDRLSCNLFEDNTWDTEPWDRQPWDYQTWDRPDLGTTDYVKIGTIDSNERKQLYNIANTIPYLKHFLTAETADGNPTNVPQYQIYIDTERLYVRFDTLPPSDLIFSVMRSTGTASEGLLSNPAIDDNFNSIKSTYKHAKAIEGVDCDDLEGCGDCTDMDGGDPEERVRGDMSDTCIIKVTQYHTGALGGWDTIPWDTAPWDTALAPIETSQFSVNVNNDYATESLSETINLAEEKTISNGAEIGDVVAFSSGRFSVGQVKINEGSWVVATEGTDYELFGDYAIKLLKPLGAGAKVRLFAGSVELKHYQIRITDCDVTDYYIEDKTIVIEQTFAFTATIDVEYYVDELKGTRGSVAIYNKHDYEVNDKMADHTAVTGQGYLTTGHTVLNDTDDNIYTWDGSSWSSEAAVDGATYFVESELEAYTLNSGTWTSEFVVGDDTNDVDYDGFAGISSALSLGYTDVGKLLNEGGWTISHNKVPSDIADTVGWWTFNSMKSVGYDDDLFYWTDVSGNGNNLTEYTNPPTHSDNVGVNNNTVDFTSSTSLQTVADSSLTGLFDDTGICEIKGSIGSATVSTLIEKTDEWSVEVIAPLDGADYSLRFTHHFSTTDGVWNISSTDFVFDTVVEISIQYLNDNVSNVPVSTVDGSAATVAEATAPVGSADTGDSTLIVGNTSAKIVSLRLNT